MTLDLGDGRVIEIVIVDYKSGKTRIGFTAPDSVKIQRNELLPDHPGDASPRLVRPGG